MDKTGEDKNIQQLQKQEEHPNLLKGNPGHKGQGRKTEYDPKYCDMLIEFFSIEPNYEKELVHTTKNGGEWIDYKKWANKLPSFINFSKEIGTSHLTLLRWANQKYPNDWPDEKLRNKYKRPDFHKAYVRAKELQKWFIIENAINGLYNPQFAIFVAKNVTNMKDKVETDITSKGEVIGTVVGFKVITPEVKETKDDD